MTCQRSLSLFMSALPRCRHGGRRGGGGYYGHSRTKCDKMHRANALRERRLVPSMIEQQVSPASNRAMPHDMISLRCPPNTCYALQACTGVCMLMPYDDVLCCRGRSLVFFCSHSHPLTALFIYCTYVVRGEVAN